MENGSHGGILESIKVPRNRNDFIKKIRHSNLTASESKADWDLFPFPFTHVFFFGCLSEQCVCVVTRWRQWGVLRGMAVLQEEEEECPPVWVERVSPTAALSAIGTRWACHTTIHNINTLTGPNNTVTYSMTRNFYQPLFLCTWTRTLKMVVLLLLLLLSIWSTSYGAAVIRSACWVVNQSGLYIRDWQWTLIRKKISIFLCSVVMVSS